MALLFLVALQRPAAAQEIVTLSPRPGATQSFFVPDMGERKHAARLVAGGEGAIRLRMEDGQIKFGQNNFLLRARREFGRNGILPVILDAPSDHAGGMSDEFRMSDTHRLDIRAVVDEIKKRYPGLPVFLVGTSRGTVSAAYAGAGLGADINGVVLSSSFFHVGGRNQKRNLEPRLSAFKWATLRSPVLLVHHAEDGCHNTPYADALKVMRDYKYPLITVFGGKPA